MYRKKGEIVPNVLDMINSDYKSILNYFFSFLPNPDRNVKKEKGTQVKHQKYSILNDGKNC